MMKSLKDWCIGFANKKWDKRFKKDLLHREKQIQVLTAWIGTQKFTKSEKWGAIAWKLEQTNYIFYSKHDSSTAWIISDLIIAVQQFWMQLLSCFSYFDFHPSSFYRDKSMDPALFLSHTLHYISLSTTSANKRLRGRDGAKGERMISSVSMLLWSLEQRVNTRTPLGSEQNFPLDHA